MLPDTKTYNAALKVVARSGREDVALALLNKMRTDGEILVLWWLICRLINFPDQSKDRFVSVCSVFDLRVLRLIAVAQVQTVYFEVYLFFHD